jgi:hypothetical protein
MQTITDTINNLRVGDASTFEALTVFPIFQDQPCEKDYLTLDEALKKDKARVTEVSDAGMVSKLLFKNSGESKVLLVDGDELIGAKQNRIINLTILVPANTELEIPVSCVEAGRWSRRSGEFYSKKRAMYSRARAAKMEQVSASLKRSGDRYSDQSEVWKEISAHKDSLSVDSPTEAMSDIYEDFEPDLNRYKKAFKGQQNQVGVVFAVSGKVQGLELFDNSQTFNHYLERLVSSYALSSFADRDNVGTVEKLDADKFIEKVKNASTERFDALGEGDDLRLSAEAMAGGALMVEDRIVHLAAFDLQGGNKQGNHRARRYYDRPLH